MANNIHNILRTRKMTQRELAARMGKFETYISDLVNRESLDGTKYGTLKEVALNLNVRVDELDAVNGND